MSSIPPKMTIACQPMGILCQHDSSLCAYSSSPNSTFKKNWIRPWPKFVVFKSIGNFSISRLGVSDAATPHEWCSELSRKIYFGILLGWSNDPQRGYVNLHYGIDFHFWNLCSELRKFLGIRNGPKSRNF